MEGLISSLIKQLTPQWAAILALLYIVLDKTGIVRQLLSARTDASKVISQYQAQLLKDLGKDNRDLRRRLDDCEKSTDRHDQEIRNLQNSEQRLRLLLRDLLQYADDRCQELEEKGCVFPLFDGFGWFVARGGKKEELGLDKRRWLN